MSGSMKFVNGVLGFVALSATERRRSSCTGGGEGAAGGGGAGAFACCGSAGLISVLNSSRMSPSGVKIRLSVTFSSFGAFFSSGTGPPSASPMESRVWNLSTQCSVEKRVDPLPRVGGCFGVVAFFVVRVHEGVTGAFVDPDVAEFTGFREVGFERLHILGRNAAVGAAEVAEERGADLRDRVEVGDEPSVVDGRRGEARLVELEGERVAAAHAPADDADVPRVD